MFFGSNSYYIKDTPVGFWNFPEFWEFHLRHLLQLLPDILRRIFIRIVVGFVWGIYFYNSSKSSLKTLHKFYLWISTKCVQKNILRIPPYILREIPQWFCQFFSCYSFGRFSKIFNTIFSGIFFYNFLLKNSLRLSQRMVPDGVPPIIFQNFNAPHFR